LTLELARYLAVENIRVRAAILMEQPCMYDSLLSPALEFEPTYKALQSLGAEVAELSRTQPETLTMALHGVSKVFVMPELGEHMVAQVSFLTSEIARSSSVRHITKVSLICSPSNVVHLAKWHRDCEVLIQKTQIPFTFINTPLPMQFLESLPIKAQNTLPLPLDAAAVAWVDIRDVARAVAKIMSSNDRKLNNRSYTISGSEALSCSQVVERIVLTLDMPGLSYVPVDEDLARRLLLSSGLTDRVVDAIMLTYAQARNGEFAAVTCDYQYLTQAPPPQPAKEPTTLNQYLQDHRPLFKQEHCNHFSDKEKAVIAQQFRAIAGEVNATCDYRTFANALGTFLSETGLCKQLFRVFFDPDRNGRVNADKFMQGMSILIKAYVDSITTSRSTQALLGRRVNQDSVSKAYD
jgi:uncharacterized protein YbjT (DUF2867 family)